MVKFDVVPTLVIDDKQNVSGGLTAKYRREGTEYSLRVADTIKDGGNVLDHTRFGLKNDTIDLSFDTGRNTGRLRLHGALTIKDKAVKVKATTHLNSKGNETSLNCTTNLDDDNTLRLIVQAKGGERPSHKDLVVGFIHRQSDFEIEPRYNFATESVSLGVTYKVDDENRLRAIYDVQSKAGSLQWTNSGALGGGGDLRVTARATVDGDVLKQVPTLTIEKVFDLDV